MSESVIDLFLLSFTQKHKPLHTTFICHDFLLMQCQGWQQHIQWPSFTHLTFSEASGFPVFWHYQVFSRKKTTKLYKVFNAACACSIEEWDPRSCNNYLHVFNVCVSRGGDTGVAGTTDGLWWSVQHHGEAAMIKYSWGLFPLFVEPTNDAVALQSSCNAEIQD